MEKNEIEVPVWAGHGTGMLFRRDALPWHHPWSTYSYTLARYLNDTVGMSNGNDFTEDEDAEFWDEYGDHPW